MLVLTSIYGKKSIFDITSTLCLLLPLCYNEDTVKINNMEYGGYVPLEF